MYAVISNPLVWITLLIGLSLVIKKGRIKSLLRNTGFILFLIFTNNGICNFFYGVWQYETIVVADISEPYDIGIVLGPFLWEGKDMPNGKEIVKFQYYRFFHAIQLYRLGKFKKILLSGYDDPEVARSYLIGVGIPSDDILMESQSQNTYENAMFSKRFLEQKGFTSNKILLITSAYHMRRAKKCFDKVGLHVTPFNVDYAGTSLYASAENWIIPNPKALNKWPLLIREWASMIYFKLKYSI